jgi:hypothetical protein
MLLPAQRNVKINSDEQHTIFAHELHSELRLAVEFSNIHCEVQQIYHFCVTNLSLKIYTKIKLTLSHYLYLLPFKMLLYL